MGPTRIRVELSREDNDKSYDILIREGALSELGDGSLPPHTERSSYLIVTDSHVAKLYGKMVRSGLERLGRKVEMVSFPAGEANKNIETASTIASELSKLGADRESVILALGGGVVGDLAGFVASIYKRGIGYAQLPTTLLAQVDSSIGGKTGVDARWGKNQLGTFYQPLRVVTDPNTLKTLPHSEIVNGVAEMVKCAIVADREMFERISSLDGFDSIPVELIVAACRIKAEVVSEDEKELNLRAILNYGHTVGHAIESSSNYRLSHGVCVILGMLAEGWIALQMGILREKDFVKQSELLLRVYTEFGVEVRRSLDEKETLLRYAFADKKATTSSIRMSLPERLGRMHVTKEGSYKIPVSEANFKRSIDHLREILPEN